ncbi:MAG: hypothetical protein R3Y06_06390 [Faecalibacterium sp.]
MQTMKDVVFTLCLASLCAGVLLHLFPDAAARRCMKAVAGLYVLSAVLGGAQDAQVMMTEMAQSVSVANESTALVYDTDTSGFEDNLLEQSAQGLNAQYDAYLAAEGYDVSVEITLAQTQDAVVVQAACVVANTPLSIEAQGDISAYLCGALALSEVTFI